ncbi:protocadherin Fat 3-like, partial [Ylistrum balloti]|uniref:protocadherin Fat 3-like n=1 Tax=Ylistrum balloti TaxID=509963 RepID=UPI002905EF39
MRERSILFILVFGEIIIETFGAACSSGELVGNSNPQSDKQNQDSSTGLSVLHSDTDYQVPCDCGEIYQWGHYARAHGDVYFQVWRDTGSTYELVGENLITFTSSNDGLDTTSISTGTIYAIQDDYLAFYQPGAPVIPYGNGNGNVNDFKRSTNVNGATTYDWGSETVDGTRNYAFNAKLNPVPTNSPTFGNLDGSASISDSATAGTSVYTVGVSDVDGDILSTEMTSVSTYFSFDSATREVSLLSTVPASTYQLVFEVADRCANTATGTLTVTVADPCAGSSSPTFSDATPTASISTTAAVVEVKVLSTVPAATYPLNFEVTDDCSNTATATLSVTVTDPCAGSSSPTFSDATPTASISTTAAVGTTVYTFTVSDVDGGTLSTVMTSSSTYFSFDTSTLEVKVLSTVPAATYPLNFEVTDDCSNTATATLSVTVTDPCAGSSSPTFSDATPTASMSTTAAVGTTVYTFTVSDVDGGTLSTVMTSSSTYFSFDTSTLEVKVLSTVPAATYPLNFEVTDDCSNTATATLSVTVTDPCAGSSSPTFSDATPTASMSTTAAVGTTVYTFTVSDVDGGTLSTVMTSSSTYFSFDTSTLEVKVLSTVPAATYPLNFEVTDDCSNTATATLSVTVTDPCAGSSSPTFSDATPTASISTTAAVVEVKVLSTVPAATYPLNFEVTDDCSNTATATLSVTVTDPCAGSSSPTFSDATPTASISTTAAVGTTVYTFTVSDVDGGTLSTVMTSSSTYFSFDTSTLEVKVASTVPAGNYSLDFQTTDDCSNMATSSLSVRVLSLSEVTPTFSVSSATPAISENSPIGTTVVRLTVTDPDGGTTNSTMTSSSAYFELDPVTLDIKVLSTLPSGTYVLDFQVVDNDGNIGTTQVNITVGNAVPLIPSLPTYAYLTETTVVETLLHTIVTSDASPADTVTCLLSASDPSSSYFTVKVISGSSYGIYSLASSSFNYATTKRYKLTINCTDTKDDVSGTFYVYILPNSPPTFANLPRGEVSNNQVIGESTVGYDVDVHVTDSTTSVGPRVITVKISNINSPPVIQNLPYPSNISILENQSAGTTVLQIVAIDVDAGQVLVYSLTVTPSSGQTMFTVDSMEVSDGQASDVQSLDVVIQNVNEAPGFSSAIYYLSANEEQLRGTSLGTPSFAVTDPESDTVSYSIDCYQLMINSSTGEITFYATYDLDLQGSSSPISCVVTADDGELTGTASLTVTINDINDNNPTFDYETYTFTSSVSAKTGDVIGTVTANDADYSALYGTVSYTINQSLLSTNFFGISGTGSLFAARDLATLGNGTVNYITVTASDTDDTSLITIIIPDYATSANDVTDSGNRYISFIEDTKNVAWLT